MKLFKKEYDREQVLYGGLIITFAILYLATAFVSFYHAITFFHIANAIWLSVILSFVAEIGQASVLFSILLTDNKNKFLPWAIMVILTSLQVIGNVVSSFDWIITHNDAGLDSFKRSILFAVQTDDPEMFRIIVAWISGALLPVIALSMTALVAQNMDLRAKKKNNGGESYINVDDKPDDIERIPASAIISEVSKIRPTEDDLSRLEEILKNKELIKKESIEEKEMGAPFDEPIYNPDMNFDNSEESYEPDEDFGPVDLTNEIPDIVPSKESEKNDTPIVQEVITPPTPEEREATSAVEEKPQSQSTYPLTQEQLDRIRQIARENLKKK